jgi:hypothetical protein
MQRCPNCHWQIPDDADSCSYCGQRLHPDSEAEEERRRLLRVHMFNVIRRKSRPSLPAVIGALLAKPFTVAMAVVIFIGITAGPILKLFPPFAPGLTLIGTVVPGGSVIVHGTEFPPGSHINLALDGITIALDPTSGDTTVRSDGTFDVQISIPGSWQPNSQHIIEAQATGQEGPALAQAQQTVTVGVEQTPTGPGGGGQPR